LYITFDIIFSTFQCATKLIILFDCHKKPSMYLLILLDTQMDTKEQIRHCAFQIRKLNTEGSYGAMTALLRELDGPSVPVALLQATYIVDEKPLALMTEPPHQPPPEKTHPTPTPDDPCTSGHLPGVRAKCLQLLFTALHSPGTSCSVGPAC
jgi:hypothetical protein